MTRSIHRKFIAGVAAAAVAITALGTSQALAGERDTERALAAILGLAVVGAIIANRRDDDRDEHVVTRDRPPHGIDRDDRPHGPAPRPLPHRAQRNLLPAECLRNVRTHHGRDMQVFGEQCLAQSRVFPGNLPRQCAQSVRGGRGDGRTTVWDAQCLERNGYRISRR